MNENQDTQTTKTLKDFEDKLNINPEFFGLFRDELVGLETNNLNFDDTVKTKSSTKTKKSTKSVKKIEKKESIKKEVEFNKEPIKTINIVNDITTCDDLNTKLEIEKKKDQEKKICSSTLVSVDDLKNLNLSKYEVFKLEEIIKFFNLYENKEK